MLIFWNNILRKVNIIINSLKNTAHIHRDL